MNRLIAIVALFALSAIPTYAQQTTGNITGRILIPGVGLGFHSDPTKSSQFSPQINGRNGRNVNYQIDGGPPKGW